jgi:uncharacterized protein YhaN
VKVSGLQIERFGIWSGVQFDNLSNGVNVFYGPNEAGKTTLMQFIRMVLYGFGGERAERYLRVADRYLRVADRGLLSAGHRVGGSLVIRTHDDEYVVRRYASRTDPLEDLSGELRVTGQDGSRQGGHRLAALLVGIDEQTFNNVYAVGLREMQYLGTLNDTQASRYLYNLSTGTDRVSLVDVMRQLQLTQTNLVGGNGESSLLEELTELRDRHIAEFGQFEGNIQRWAQHKGDLEQVDDEVARIESSILAQARRASVQQLAACVQPIWKQRQEIERELQSFGPAPAVTPETRSQLDELARQMDARRTQIDELEQQCKSLDHPDDIQVLDDETFARNVMRVEALLDQRSTITSLDDQSHRLLARLEETEFEVQAELERLGLLSGTESPLEFDDQTLALLEGPARQVERDRDMLERVKKSGSGLRDESDKISRELAEALGQDHDATDRHDSHQPRVTQDTGVIAANIRRRMVLDSKLNDLRDQLEDCDNRRRAILRSQLLPWQVICVLGILFAVGVLLLLLALFGRIMGFTDPSRTTMAILGALAAVAAVLLKLQLHGSGRRDLLVLQEQTDTLQRELGAAEQEAQRLDREILGRREGAFQLGPAQKRLARLESLLPLDARRRDLQDGCKKYEQRAIEIAARLKNSRQRWTDALSAAGLPPRLPPAKILQLASESGKLARLNREAFALRNQIAATELDRDMLDQRAAGLFADLGIKCEQTRLAGRLEALTTAMRLFQQRRELAEQRRESERQRSQRQRDLRRGLQQLTAQRRALLAAQGAVDDDDLQRLLQRRTDWEQLRTQRDALHEKNNAILVDQRDELSVTAELFNDNKIPLEERIRNSELERSRMDARLKELLSRRGELVKKIRALGQDRQLPSALLDIGIVDAKIDEAVEQARIVGAITTLLRTVYRRYEHDRQPETLKEASNYLRRMTGGKYTRIWTPLDQDTLLVDDPARLSIPVDQLSRGTREQLFLALRLALVAGYARRGIRIPLVLDDVLVNFDVQRTRAAAEVLTEFARAGNQVLVFSCHQHVMEIFAALGVEIRTLPGHELPVTRMGRHAMGRHAMGQAEPMIVADEQIDVPPAHLSFSRPRFTNRIPQQPTEFTIGYQDNGWEDRLFGFEETPEFGSIGAVSSIPEMCESDDEHPLTMSSGDGLEEERDRRNEDSGNREDVAEPLSACRPPIRQHDLRHPQIRDWFDEEDDLRDSPLDRPFTPHVQPAAAVSQTGLGALPEETVGADHQEKIPRTGPPPALADVEWMESTVSQPAAPELTVGSGGDVAETEIRPRDERVTESRVTGVDTQRMNETVVPSDAIRDGEPPFEEEDAVDEDPHPRNENEADEGDLDGEAIAEVGATREVEDAAEADEDVQYEVIDDESDDGDISGDIDGEAIEEGVTSEVEEAGETDVDDETIEVEDDEEPEEEASEDGDVEYEYETIEVEVDEDPEEEASADTEDETIDEEECEDGPEEDAADDEYEYVEVEDDEDPEEEASVDGDVQYETIEVEEDEEEVEDVEEDDEEDDGNAQA